MLHYSFNPWRFACRVFFDLANGPGGYSAADPQSRFQRDTAFVRERSNWIYDKLYTPATGELGHT